MGRIQKFLQGVRKPQITIVAPGNIVLINGRAYRVYDDRMQLLPIKRIGQ